MGLIILALLGIGATAFAVDELFFDEDADTEDDELDIEDEISEQEIVMLDENGVLVGTSGADILSDEESEPVEIRAGDGADQINVTADDGIDVFGEAGNDLINVQRGLENFVSGGLGDDTISADGGSEQTIQGDEGDDDITYTSLINGSDVAANEPFLLSGAVFVDGGAGDDTLTINAAADSNIGPAIVTGGEGQDVIDIDLTTTDFNFTANQINEEFFLEFDQNGEVVGEIETPIIPAGTFATITDFDPEEDQLVLDIRDTHDQTSGAHVFDRAELNETSTGTTISLFFESARPDDPESTYLLETKISLLGVQGLSLENDLVLLTT